MCWGGFGFEIGDPCQCALWRYERGGSDFCDDYAWFSFGFDRGSSAVLSDGSGDCWE
jgi:hypothetical protein